MAKHSSPVLTWSSHCGVRGGGSAHRCLVVQGGVQASEGDTALVHGGSHGAWSLSLARRCHHMQTHHIHDKAPGLHQGERSPAHYHDTGAVNRAGHSHPLRLNFRHCRGNSQSGRGGERRGGGGGDGDSPPPALVKQSTANTCPQPAAF